jgi:hypothetical protein
VAAISAYMIKMNVMWVWWFFGAGLLLGAAAQVIAYLSGQPTCKRKVGLFFGIAALILMFVASQIAGAKLRDYANFISGRISGESL